MKYSIYSLIKSKFLNLFFKESNSKNKIDSGT
ncbi:MAG: hypothetical protein HW421_2367 [Ignavibacteria bacterium]|nr:hypothetical protein [Ignavibacteria bacterium]